MALEKSIKTPVLFYGGSRGGGKSYLVRVREYTRRLTNPNTKGLIVRKTYPELLANHIRMFFKEYPVVRKWYNKAEKTIYWPNGSTTEFSYLRNTDDVYTYQGREYEDISVDEVTQHDWDVIRILRASNRTTKDLMPTMFLTGNPGGVGHQQVKRIFIDRDFRVDERPEDYDFVQASVWDNEALMEADPDYINRLRALPEQLMKAYLYGDWNIFAGTAFHELTKAVHIIPPFELPRSAKYFAGYDWGFNHPFAFVLCAITQEKDVYVVGGVSDAKKRIDEQAKLIKNLIGDRKLTVFCGHDCWDKSKGPTVADQLRSQLPQCSWIRAFIKREQGVATMRKLFAYQNTEKGVPQLKFFKNAETVYDTVSGMQFDERKPEDVMKVDANEYGVGGDDYFDALRYAVVTWLRPKVLKPERPEPTTAEYLRDHIERSDKILESAFL